MHLILSIKDQKLTLYTEGESPQHYTVSTAKKGTGQQSGSQQTPLGQHIIRAKIGQGQPKNSVFIGRRPTGEIYSTQLACDNPDRTDWILSRILWLSGLEPGFNRLGTVDSMRRFIYIHGTPDSEPMGVPQSHGCVRMRNEDVIELFSQVEVGTVISIER